MISQHFSNYHNIFEGIKEIDYLISQSNKYLIWIDNTNCNINWLFLPGLTQNFQNRKEEEINNSNNENLEENNILISEYEVMTLNHSSNSIYYSFHFGDMIITDFCCKGDILSILVGEFDPYVFIIDLGLNKVLTGLHIEVYHKVLKIYYSPSGNRLTAYTLDNKIYLYDISFIHQSQTQHQTQQQITHQPTQQNSNNDTPDEEEYNIIPITIMEQIPIKGWIYYFCPLLFFNDTKIALYNGDLCIYDINKKEWVYEIKENLGMRRPIKSLNLSPCENYIFIECFHNIIKQYSTHKNKVIASYCIDEPLKWKENLFIPKINNTKLDYLGPIDNKVIVSDIIKYKINIFNMEKIINADILYLDKGTDEIDFFKINDTSTYNCNHTSITIIQNKGQVIIINNSNNSCYIKNCIYLDKEYIVYIKRNQVYKFLNIDMDYNNSTSRYFPKYVNNMVNSLLCSNKSSTNNTIAINYNIYQKIISNIKLYKLLLNNRFN